MTLQNLIDGAQKIVLFGGAGLSTESGIPDYRSVDGLYHQKFADPPERILSHTYFMEKPRDFYAFIKKKWCIWRQNLILRISNSRSWNARESRLKS